MARRFPLSIVLLLLTSATVLCTGCQTAPITGRKQMLLLAEEQELNMGLSAYNDILAKEPLSQNAQYTELVKRVGQRIAAVAGRPDYQWEFKTIASEQQNAFCLPGGKVAVYEGIIPICATEAGLAVVISHEVAHALARHGGERMSQNMAVDGVKQAFSYVLQNQDQARREIVMQAYGVGSQYGVLLPYSRKHESEADHIGLLLMARAGYDPREAPRFWQRFGAVKFGEKPIEFFSTHPSDQRRAADLAVLVPDAMKLYEQAPEQFALGEIINPAPPTQTAVASVPERIPPPLGEVAQPRTTPPGALASPTALLNPFSNWKLPPLPPILAPK